MADTLLFGVKATKLNDNAKTTITDKTIRFILLTFLMLNTLYAYLYFRAIFILLLIFKLYIIIAKSL